MYILPLISAAVYGLPVISAISLDALSSYLNDISKPFFNAPELRLLEFGPNDQKWVKEDDIYKYKAMGVSFMDVTDHVDFYNARDFVTVQESPKKFPDAVHHRPQVEKLSKNISKMNMKNNLSQLTSFFNRYFKSEDGYRSSAWISQQIDDIAAANNENVTVSLWDHEWQQKSVVARIPGSKNPEHVVVLGAHLDSVNGQDRFGRSPGADDDGSGTVTIWEVFRILLEDGFEPENTVEFHWYSAEEGGLLGSQDIYTRYASEEKQVKAMLQQDMTGYTEATLASGEIENFGVVTDRVNPNLTNFVKLLIEEYSDIPYVEFQCGYGCSDHASAFQVGYPSSFVIETGSGKKAPNQHVHTDHDVVRNLDFKHMSRHAKLSLAFVYELGFYNFE
jgi:leucyl aminopeptidase